MDPSLRVDQWRTGGGEDLTAGAEGDEHRSGGEHAATQCRALLIARPGGNRCAGMESRGRCCLRADVPGWFSRRPDLGQQVGWDFQCIEHLR